MDAPTGFVEFYIACNPPLLPKGVRNVIEAAKSSLSEDELTEILFEPEIPWFKCITAAANQQRVTTVIQDLLLKILEEETDIVQPGTLDPLFHIDGTAQPDVRITVPDPQVIPWCKYISIDEVFYASYDEHRYPEVMMSLNFKSVWGGLENSPGGTFTNLLESIRAITKDEAAPASISDFEALTGCTISHNMRETLIYIGTNTSQEMLEMVIQKLEAILSFLVQKPRSVAHMILTEGAGSSKIAYRWLSHVGLARSTFPETHHVSGSIENGSLMNTATVRTEKKDRHERWVLDTTVYCLQNDPTENSSGIWEAFAGYKFRSKIESREFHAKPYHLITPRNKAEKQLPTMNNTHTLTEPLDLMVGGMTVSSGSQAEVQRHSINTPQKSTGNSGLGSQRQTETAHTFGDLVGSPAGVDKNAMTEEPTMDNIILNWRNSVESVISHEILEPSTIQRRTEDLISLEEPEDGRVQSQQTPSLSQSIMLDLTQLQGLTTKAVERTDAFKKCEDLIWLEHDHGPQSSLLDTPNPTMHYGYPEPYMDQNTSTIPQRGNDIFSMSSVGVELKEIKESVTLPDSETKTSGTEADPYAVANFGLMDDVPKDFYRTMSQQGSRDRPRLKKVPLSSLGIIDSSLNDSQLPRADVVQKPWQLSAAIPKNDSTKSSKSSVDRDWPTPGELPPSTKKAKNPILNPHAPEWIIPPTVDDGAPQLPSSIFHNFKDTRNPPQGVDRNGRHGDEHAPTMGNMGKPVTTMFDKSEILKETELQLKNMARLLQWTPGSISIEVKFGRILLKQLSPSLVHNGSGPSFSLDEAGKFLNGSNFPQGCIGFSPILSTCGADMNTLVEIRVAGDTHWNLSGKHTWFEFTCQLADETHPFIVDLEADSFRYRCRGIRHEVLRLFLHCPQSAWDLKACATRSSVLDQIPKYRSLAEALTTAIAINVDGEGNPRIKVPQDGSLHATISSVNIRHEAEYRQKGQGASVLNITETRRMQESTVSLESADQKSSKVNRVKVWTCVDTSTNSRDPHRYFEASISSASTKQIFEPNVNLQYGEKASWEVDALEDTGVFEDICRPAFMMVTLMDQIGHGNDNKQGLSGLDAMHQGTVTCTSKETGVVFW